MCWKSFMIQNKKLKLEVQTIYKKCDLIAWSVEKKRESKNPKVAKTKNGQIMLLSKCAVCDNKYKNISNSKKLVDC